MWNKYRQHTFIKWHSIERWCYLTGQSYMWEYILFCHAVPEPEPGSSRVRVNQIGPDRLKWNTQIWKWQTGRQEPVSYGCWRLGWLLLHIPQWAEHHRPVPSSPLNPFFPLYLLPLYTGMFLVEVRGCVSKVESSHCWDDLTTVWARNMMSGVRGEAPAHCQQQHSCWRSGKCSEQKMMIHLKSSHPSWSNRIWEQFSSYMSYELTWAYWSLLWSQNRKHKLCEQGTFKTLTEQFQ